MNILKKIASPFVYTLALPVISIILLQLILGLPSLSIWREGDISTLVYLILLGGFILFLANKLVNHIEKPATYHILDHIRHSVIYYVIFILGGIYYIQWITKYPISSCQTDCFGYGIGLLPILISFLAILINGFYLYSKKLRMQKDEDK